MDVAIAVVAALTSHKFVFAVGEWHLQSTRLLELLILSYVALIILATELGGLTLLESTSRISLTFGIYLFSLWASIITKRLLLHPLRAFPGPVGARISKLWHVAQCWDSKNHILLEQLREQYGDFIRTGRSMSTGRHLFANQFVGPDELTIIQPDVLPIVLEGSTNTFTKAPWYDNLRPWIALNTQRNPVNHDRRRRIWDRGFSTRGRL